jgi:hypothetical protein
MNLKRKQEQKQTISYKPFKNPQISKHNKRKQEILKLIDSSGSICKTHALEYVLLDHEIVIFKYKDRLRNLLEQEQLQKSACNESKIIDIMNAIAQNIPLVVLPDSTNIFTVSFCTTKNGFKIMGNVYKSELSIRESNYLKLINLLDHTRHFQDNDKINNLLYNINNEWNLFKPKTWFLNVF